MNMYLRNNTNQKLSNTKIIGFMSYLTIQLPNESME